MELTSKLNVAVAVAATLREADDSVSLSLRVTGHAEYDKNKVASTEVELTGGELYDAVYAALRAVAEDGKVQERLRIRMADAIFTSRRAAAALGELKS